MQILYFASIREQIGKSEEIISKPDNVATVADLVAHLRSLSEAHHNALESMMFVRIAVNQTHAQADHPVKENDEIAFFPPVTGG